jgi:tripartite-type tricarboxylate transporter receptor subunit TctC
MSALFRCIAVLATALACTPAHPQAFPSRPLRFIMPFPPGEGGDIVLRRAAVDLGAKFGQPVVVDNRAGGSFVVGAEACRASAPDGYTVCVVNGTMLSINPHTLAKIPYDPEKDFRPLTNMYMIISGLYSSGPVPVTSLKDLGVLVAAKPGTLNFATLGPGSSTDVIRQWLNEQWRGEMVGIPYKGGNLVIAALASNETQITWIGLVNALGQVRAGKVRALAVNGTRRSPLVPDVPTFQEAGLPPAPLPGWHGLAMPGGTADVLMRRLNADIVAVLTEPKFVEYLYSQGLEPAAGPADDFAAFIRKDREEVGSLVRKFNIPRQ